MAAWMWFIAGFAACMTLLVVLSQTPVAAWLHRRAARPPEVRVRGPNEKAQVGEQITAVVTKPSGEKKVIAT